jgi:hypothetical protein
VILEAESAPQEYPQEHPIDIEQFRFEFMDQERRKVTPWKKDPAGQLRT